MLVIRPNCECCDKDLPPNSADARICSYECTFCVICVEFILDNVCPNCGGGFVNRPIRPTIAHRPGVSLGNNPASIERVHTVYTREDIAAFVGKLRAVLPELR